MPAVDEARLIIQGIEFINQELPTIHLDNEIEEIKEKCLLLLTSTLWRSYFFRTPGPDCKAMDN